MNEIQTLRIQLHGFQQNNEEHSKWAKSYLAKKGVFDFRFSDPEEASSPQYVAIPWQDGDEKIDYPGIYKNMPLAWAQRKRRQESDLKPYSFFMDMRVGPALNRLASRKNSPISVALETLILEEQDLASEYARKLNEDKQEYRAKYDQRGAARLAKQAKSRDRKLIERQWSAIEELANRLAEIEASGQFDHSSTQAPDKKSEAVAKRKEEILKPYRDILGSGSS